MGWLSNLFGFGGDSQPKTQTTIATSKLPEEIAPHTKRVLAEQEALYNALIERGYDPYPGDVFAPFTEEQEQAMKGISGLVGGAKPYFEEALDIYRTGAEKFTPEAAQEYMSPYQRAVTDIEKREAQKVFERDIMPRFEQQAVTAGGMSGLGSRAAIQAGQLGQAQMQQMGDIEAKGLQRAYMDAQRGFAEQKARERQLAGDIGRTGPAMLQAGLAEQGILQDIGQQKREMAQGALDEAYYKFLKEQAYPQDILASYSGTTYGASPFVGPSGTKIETGPPTGPSAGQQLLGLGMQGLNLYGMSGGFGSSGPSWGTLGKSFGYPMKAGGGKVGGLSDLPIVHRQSGSTGASLPVTEAMSRLRKQYAGATDENEKKEIQERLNIASQDPARKRGRAATTYGAQVKDARELLEAQLAATKALKGQKLSSIGKVLAAKEKGTGVTEEILRKAAQERGVSRDALEKQLKGVKRMGPGIRGIAPATTGKRQSFWSALNQIVDATTAAAQEHSAQEAKRNEARIRELSKMERADLAKKVAEDLTTAKERAEASTEAVTSTGAAEKEALAENWKAQKEELTTKQKAKLNRLIAENNLQDEIAGWPSKQQDQLLEISKKKWGIKKIQAEIEKLKVEARSAKSKGKIPKLTEPVRKAMELASLKDLGYSAVYNKDGELVSISGEEELSTDEVKILAQYERDFLERYAILIDQGKSEPTALSKARTYAGQQHLKRKKKISPAAAVGTPPPAAGTPPPAAGGNIQGLITLPP